MLRMPLPLLQLVGRARRSLRLPTHQVAPEMPRWRLHTCSWLQQSKSSSYELRRVWRALEVGLEQEQERALGQERGLELGLGLERGLALVCWSHCTTFDTHWTLAALEVLLSYQYESRAFRHKQHAC